MNTDTCIQGACKLTTFLTFLIKWGKINDDNKRLSDAEFIIKEKELEHYTSLA